MKNTRIQVRGECCICGKDHAVKGALLVNHGYTVRWGSINNVCSGANNVHYGHKKAPVYLASYIESLEDYLANRLPEYLASAKARFLQAKSEHDAHEGYSGNLSKRLSVAQREYLEFKADFEVNLPAAIAMFSARKDNWVERDTYEVDLDVEEAEVRKAREAEAKAKKAAKLAEKEVKDKAKAEREAAAFAKFEAKWEALSANNYYRLFYCGEVVESWQQTLLVNDYEIYQQLHLRRAKHWLELNGTDIDQWGNSSYMLEIRTETDGGGKRLFDTAIQGSATAYFAHYAD
jgi:hypothetical protein